nr:flagellin [uncultured Oscillibacter sp.]
MRIQHNIMAMNAYRNYNTNTSALAKNLEKLSSGYKINRAGDDAAGLAISEKMRAQITGLNAAQKNVKDGISLVKTAEGAMQEIQDMLNRMDYLATQSANGTYDNEVDRANLQKEVDALKSEIDRIADSSNFNGIKLLDGSLAGSGSTSGVSSIKTSLPTTNIKAVAGKYESAAVAADTTVADGDKLTLTVGLDNGKAVNLEFTVDATNKKLIGANGEYAIADAAKATPAELGKAAQAELAKVMKDFTVTETGGKLTFESKTAGTGAVKVDNVSWRVNDDAPTALAVTVPQAAADAKTGIKAASITEYDGTNEEDAVFTLNGKKYVIADTANVDVSNLSDKGIVVISGALGTDDDAIAQQLAQKTGMTVAYNTDTFEFSAGTGSAASGGLQLQIGDTADAFNQMKVIVGDMHTKALGIAGLDISDPESAAGAIETIRAAINNVSSVRGDLGATQNRLEHTQKNLSVMAENIQDAESTIRDTDVAEEMMAYTKNNILIQSAQAMLAQANAVPQGVLQLLG